MLLLKVLVLGFSLWCLKANAQASKQFTEIYQVEDNWRVDQFEVQTGQLQDLISSDTFTYRYQAEAFAKTLSVSTDKSMVKLVSTEIADASLWKVTNTWSQAWEDKYALWVQKNLDEEFFVRYNFKTDCADVAYTLRWIFARDNNLPASATLAGTAVTVTQEALKREWAALPTHIEWHKDQRFLAALGWLMDNVYTKTLFLDAYPVEIRKETIQAGLVNLLGSHTEIFNQVSYDPELTPLEVMSSTLPVKVRKLDRRIFMDTESSDKKDGGLVKFRWPVLKNGKWVIISKEKMPYYSLEQFKDKLCEGNIGFAKCIMQRLDMKFQPELIVRKLISSQEAILKARLAWVNEGSEFCSSNECSPGTPGYEDYGTPSRDKRILNNFHAFRDISSEFDLSTYFDKWEETAIVAGLPEKLTMMEFKERLESGFVSYDPRDSVGARWGLSPGYIQETVLRKYAQAQILRMDLIRKAAPCRNDAEKCKSSLKSFNELSTVELDLEMQNLIGNLFAFCSKNHCPANQEVMNASRLVWTKSPAPWDPIDARLGKLIDDKKAHFLLTETVTSGGKNHLILDGSSLYDLRTRKTKKLFEGTGSLTYDQSLDLLVVMSGNEMKLYDQSLVLVNKVTLPFNSESIQLKNLGQGKLLIYVGCMTYVTQSCDDLTSPWLIDLVEVKFQALTRVKKLIFPSQSPKAALLVGDRETNLLQMTDRGLIFTVLPHLAEEIQAFELLENQTLLATKAEGTVAGFYSKSGWKTLLESEESIDIERVNSFYVSLSAYNSSKDDYYNWIYGKDLKLVVANKVADFSLRSPQDKRIVFLDSQAYVFDGAGYKKMSGILPNTLESASTQWISINTNKGAATILDYSGKIQETSKWFLKTNCYSKAYNNLCFARDESLLMEEYKLASENYEQTPFTYFRIGAATAFKFTETYAYVIEKEDEEHGESGEGYEEEQQDNKSIGKKIILRPGLIMWFPEKI